MNFNKTRCGEQFWQSLVEAVWEKGQVVPGWDPNLFRADACGAMMMKSAYGQTTDWGWEIDHIKPLSKGGCDDLDNLQPLQWENNRRKSDQWPWSPGESPIAA